MSIATLVRTRLDRRESAIRRPSTWTIYPDGRGAYACGSPDGPVLCDGQVAQIFLGGIWVAGVIEQRPYAPARFVATRDRSICGLCPGMQVRLEPDGPQKGGQG